MNSKVAAEWSTYNVVLYHAQRPPPLGTVDTGEKLEQMAREHLVRVANEGAIGVNGSSTTSQLDYSLQVLSCMSLEVLACGKPTKPIAKLSINGL